MRQYLDLLQDILQNGTDKMDRTGTGTRSVFGRQMHFDLNKGFPLITTKKMGIKSILSELLWFLEGSTNEHRLAEIKNNYRPYDSLNEKEKHTIWTANYEKQGKDLGYESGELGPIYSAQWNNFNGEGINQIQNVIDLLKNDPSSRRMVVCAWNPAQLNKMALPPCHALFQFYVANNKLSCQLYVRSQDVFLGCPYNIASYSLLTMMIAQVCGLELGEYVHTTGDTHIYLNHIDQVKEQLKRIPHKLPTIRINPEIKRIEDFKMSDFELLNYECDDTIKADMAV